MLILFHLLQKEKPLFSWERDTWKCMIVSSKGINVRCIKEITLLWHVLLLCPFCLQSMQWKFFSLKFVAWIWVWLDFMQLLLLCPAFLHRLQCTGLPFKGFFLQWSSTSCKAFSTPWTSALLRTMSFIGIPYINSKARSLARWAFK